MPLTVPSVGTVEAVASVQIRSLVTGQLQVVHFTEGQEVRQGDPLFSLDSRPFKAALQQAEATLARDTATLRNAQTEQTRTDTLFDRGLISRDQYDSQRATTAVAAASVEADKAAVETPRLNVLYADIVAPTAGRTGSLGAHVGDLVRANDTSTLVVINQMAPIYVTFSVPGRYLDDIRRYQAMRPLAVQAGIQGATSTDITAATATVTGEVSFIDNAVDPTTGTIRLKGTFPNADRRLWPGAFVQVTLNLSTDPNAIVVPQTAVQSSQDGSFIYVVKADHTVDMRKVKVARQQGDEVIIADGISAGDVVVTDGQLRLTPGARVTEPGADGGRRGSGSPAGRAQ